MRLVVVWLINTVALLAVSYLMSSVQVTSFGAALIAAGVLGLVNAFIRPVLKILTFPLILVTLGLFALVVNGLMLWLTSSLSSALGLGFHVSGFWAAFWGGVVVSLVSMILSMLVTEPPRRNDWSTGRY